LAILAGAVGPAEPGNTDARAENNLLRASTYNFADNLVARNHLRLLGRQLSFHDVQVGATDAAGAHAQQNISGHGLWIGDFGDLKGPLRYGLRRGEDSSFHVDQR
jgi:hypothetical protein